MVAAILETLMKAFLSDMTVVAGHSVVAAINEDRARAVISSAHMPDCADSESLCAHQRRMSGMGYLGAEIVKSNYGYSVRYDSGLQDFGLLAGSRSGPLDGSYDDAVRWAIEWQARDAGRRYVWVRR